MLWWSGVCVYIPIHVQIGSKYYQKDQKHRTLYTLNYLIV